MALLSTVLLMVQAISSLSPSLVALVAIFDVTILLADVGSEEEESALTA